VSSTGEAAFCHSIDRNMAAFECASVRMIMFASTFSRSVLAGAGGAANFEWAGIFDTSQNMYVWTAQKVGGSYADPGMKLVALPSQTSSESVLHSLEVEGNQTMTLACQQLVSGGVITPARNRCYQLNFDQTVWQTLFKVDSSGTQAIAFFAEHFPTEFESTAHYLKDINGTDIEPEAQLPETTATPAASAAPADKKDKDKHNGAIMGAAVLVNLVTLIGVVFLVPVLAKMATNYSTEFEGVVCGFAAGALLACAFFLLLFEATHLVGTGWSKEVDVLWRWGTMILAGFVLPALIDNVVATVATKAASQNASPEAAVADGETGSSPKQEGPDMVARSRIIGGVLIGDFFHNLCDGFFIAAAFRGCGDSFGWGVALATILHELPQEIADYAILTSSQVALHPLKALVANFISGLSVILGAIIIITTEVQDDGIGLLLAFGGGAYLHVAAVDCMPKIYNKNLSLSGRLSCLVAFMIGAILIGLILLDHEHCVPASSGAGGSPKPSGHHHH